VRVEGYAMTTGRPRLSVVISNYNHGVYLSHALLAMVNQSLPPWEILIVDDASNDHSVALIRQFQRYYPYIQLQVNERNHGYSRNINALIQVAEGDYLYAAASDDFVEAGFFEKATGALEEVPVAGFAFGQMNAVDEAGRYLGRIAPTGLRGPRYLTPAAFLSEYLDVEAPNHSLCGATLYRAEALKRIGYLERLGSWADTFAARAIGLQRGACYLPEPFMNWRQLRDNQSTVAGRSRERMARLIDDAVELMGSPPYRQVFPADHVQRWANRYREFVGVPFR
jgi:glycosyltransferase involved in cell wall biosynthesis